MLYIMGSDLQTWLSAALVNQDTCMEGFDGTSNILKGLVSSSISEITSLVRDLLSKVYPSSKPKSYAAGGGGGGVHGHGGRKSTAGDAQQFPSWVRPNDRKLLRVSRVAADVVVAQDGTGNFTSVQDAVMAAPDYSTRRFLIYV
ncbi:hypothetical protein SAY86_024165 [Trapa natans]|uniref:Pectinesterase inhibitor domain-containing protein n=1 Tax=Trapa natans TaxID=22666 RepID=A0AAN7RA07_TRANT|nr:hypothetical protein SAY86_024165 [Trapa natans]